MVTLKKRRCCLARLHNGRWRRLPRGVEKHLRHVEVRVIVDLRQRHGFEEIGRQIVRRGALADEIHHTLAAALDDDATVVGLVSQYLEDEIAKPVVVELKVIAADARIHDVAVTKRILGANGRRRIGQRDPSWRTEHIS